MGIQALIEARKKNIQEKQICKYIGMILREIGMEKYLLEVLDYFHFIFLPCITKHLYFR